MFIMEPGSMEETSTENAKISDSGYSNTCSNSQSHTRCVRASGGLAGTVFGRKEERIWAG